MTDSETGKTGGAAESPERPSRGRAADVLTGQTSIRQVIGKIEKPVLPEAEEPVRFPWDDRAQVRSLTPDEFEDLRERFQKFLGE